MATSVKYITREEFAKHNTRDSAWIEIDGAAYDVTEWMEKHPGGERIIFCLAGHDASWNFLLNHNEHVRKRLPSLLVGLLEPKAKTETTQKTAAMLSDFRDMHQKFEKLGYFNTRPLYFIWKYILAALFFVVAFWFFYLSNKKENFWIGALGACSLGLGWQQWAFIGHDLAHNGIIHEVFWASILGMFEANFIQGISSGWWKYTHNVHHIRTNDLYFDPDIQHLPVFAITVDYFNSVWSKFHRRKLDFNWVSKILVGYQHVHFLPVLLFSRVFLYMQSLIYVFYIQPLSLDGQKRRWIVYSEIVSMVGFFAWMPLLFYNTYAPMSFFFLAHAVAGILHIQIVANHFACPVYEDIIDDNFVLHQFKTSMAISSNQYTDWFHGGLQYQVEHHLFPMMPRHNLKLIKPEMLRFCQKHGITYLEDSLFGAVKQIYYVLRETAHNRKVAFPLQFY